MAITANSAVMKNKDYEKQEWKSPLLYLIGTWKKSFLLNKNKYQTNRNEHGIHITD